LYPFSLGMCSHSKTMVVAGEGGSQWVEGWQVLQKACVKAPDLAGPKEGRIENGAL
jgi:hypothetical protein